MKVCIPTTDNTPGGLLITAMFGLGMALSILIGNTGDYSPVISAGIILSGSLIGILIGIGLFNRRRIGGNGGYRTVDLESVFE